VQHRTSAMAMLLRGAARGVGGTFARKAPALGAIRGMAGPVKVHFEDQEQLYGPSEVARTEPKIEMGVRYEAGVPSPMEGAHYNEPIVVDGLVAKTGGEFNRGLGSPVQYIKLSAWDPTPVECKYTGLLFVSKKALEYAAKHGK